ncbi:hypothetical protein ACFQ51_00675 [Streptomyces kaempferi]
MHTLANMDLCPDELLAHLDDTISRLDAEDSGTPGRVGAEAAPPACTPFTTRPPGAARWLVRVTRRPS